jgi:hypothetical protein
MSSTGSTATTVHLQPRAWALQLRDLDELKPDLLHLALVLALNANEVGEVRVFLKSLALQLGQDPEDDGWPTEARRIRKRLERLRDLGLLRLVGGPTGRAKPSIWQLVRA